jgi:hypothetical protein
MLSLDWGVLRVGDRVQMHDADRADLVLIPGIVETINGRKRSKGIGIRVGSTPKQVIMWPGRMAVHLDPRDPTDQCWRCLALTRWGLTAGALA